MPLQCYNCNEPGHRAADCPHACFRCGGDHWFAKCPAPGEVELERLFAQFDAGQKGYLDRSDIAAALRHYKLPQENAGKLMQRMAAGSDKVTLADFLLYGQRKQPRIQLIFDNLDQNGSGSINRYEFKAALEGMGMQPTDDEVRAMIRIVDRPMGNGCKPNGKIELHELRDFMLFADVFVFDFSPLADDWLDAVQAEGVSALSNAKPVSISPPVSAMFGGAANGFSRTCVAPLERLRLQMIADQSRGSIMGVFRSIYQNEGTRGLWRGNVLNVIRIVPQSGIAFLTKDVFKSMVGGKDATPLGLVGSSMLSGMTCMTAVYPLDMIRGRVTTTPGLYRGMWDGLSTVARTEGYSAWYKGLAAANAWAVPYYGVQFFVYDSLQKLHSTHLQPRFELLRTHAANTGAGLLYGGIAGAACTTAAFPFEFVRRQLQVQGVGGRPFRYKGVIDCTRQVVAERGLRGLFAGLGANLLKSPLNVAIVFGCYETLVTAAKVMQG